MRLGNTKQDHLGAVLANKANSEGPNLFLIHLISFNLNILFPPAIFDKLIISLSRFSLFNFIAILIIIFWGFPPHLNSETYHKPCIVLCVILRALIFHPYRLELYVLPSL